MGLRCERFGTSADGKPVELYTLANANGLQAQIATLGGTLVSLHVPDRSGTLDDVVLGFDVLEPYTAQHPYFGSIIGRYANRIANAAFELDSKAYSLPANDGTHHLHGGPCGFHTVLWKAHAVETDDGCQLTLRYTSPNGEQGYPGTLSVEVRYTLTHGGALRLEYSATTDAATVVNLTNHTYFNLAGGGTVQDHALQIAAHHFLPVNATLIPRGERLAVDGTPFDFRQARRIGTRMSVDHEQFARGRGYDHCWILDTQQSYEKAAASLYDPGSGRSMRIFTTQPGLQFYSGNLLDGTLAGKRGKHYAIYSGLCLETQHFPDSPNQPAFPSTVLRPGETYRHRTEYAFSIGEPGGSSSTAVS